jgi:hypothetical protein
MMIGLLNGRDENQLLIAGGWVRIFFLFERDPMKTVMMGTVLWLALAGVAMSQQPPGSGERAKITVNGEATVNVKPDKIVLVLGIDTSDADVVVAKQKNGELMKKAVEIAKECGVQEKQIQTDYLSIEPRWKDGYDRENFLGYFVVNTLMVTLSDLEQLDRLITSVLQAGISRINGIDYQSTQFKKYREQARELALKAAKEKGEKMSAVLGQKIGKPIQISENYTRSGWYGGWGGGRSSGMSQQVVNAISDVGGDGEISESVALGMLGIGASVTVTFELAE